MTDTVRLTDYISADRVILELKARTKTDVLTELANFSVEKGLAPDAKKVFEGLQARENLISTAVGDGVAIPHTRLEGLAETFLIIARSQSGIDFDSLDGRLTYLFVTIIGPVDSDREQLKILSRTARFLKRQEFREQVRIAETAEQIVEQLFEEDRILRTI
ncbi:MAG: PTS sugar transporter subunit IIA [Candidatus Omnitrophica bacterium]|nr:PTS sugar transporter subunit IIA [Candidatus Omnitrophota bacterium]